MAGTSIPVLCYWGGNICYGEQGSIWYDMNARRSIMLRRGTTYTELLAKMYALMKVDMTEFCLKMICRFPINHNNYIPLEVVDDETVQTMIEVVLENQALYGIDLYVKKENVHHPCAVSQPLEMESGSYTRLPTQDNDGPIANSILMAHQTASPVLINNTCHTEHMSFLIEHLVQVESEDICNHDINLNDCAVISDEDNDVVQLADNDDMNEPGEHSIPLHKADSPFFLNVDFGDDVGSSGSTLPHHTQIWDPLRCELAKGIVFNDKEKLQHAVKEFSIRSHHQYEVLESNTEIWVVRCKLHEECGCKWRLRAIKRKKTGRFEITKYEGPHTCLPPRMNLDHVQLDSKLIASEIQGTVRVDPAIKIDSIVKQMQEKYNYNISYRKAWIAKEKAIAMIFGDWESSYRLLPKFMGALIKYNPGTIVKWLHCNTDNQDVVQFGRIFWSLSASIQGFVHCRPLISIDGTHLYGKYNGKLLIAMAIDGNNQLFPLAFAIVEEESYNSWLWFLTLLRLQVVGMRQGVCLISDRHKNIIAAVNNVNSEWQEPNAYHRFCLRYVRSNFNSKFKDAHLKSLVWAAGSAHQIHKFNSIMQEIKTINPKAWAWLNNIPAAQWTIAHDGGRRYGHLTTNISEVFNGVLKGARNLPISACVQLIFYRLVKYFCGRRASGQKALCDGSTYTHFATTKILRYQSKLGGHRIIEFNRNSGEAVVITRRGNSHAVLTRDSVCSCGKWVIYKIPCSHALAVFAQASIDGWSCIDECYKLSKNMAIYASEFHPLHHPDYWDEPTGPSLCPNPTLKRIKGRPHN